MIYVRIKSALRNNKEQVEYPFSILRVFLYFFGGLSALILSIPILLQIYSDPLFALVTFFVLTAVVIVVSFQLKLYLLRKMQEYEEEKLASASKSKPVDRRFFVIVFLIVLALVLPVVIFYVLDIQAWFMGLVCFVVGFCLSEPFLYWFIKRE